MEKSERGDDWIVELEHETRHTCRSYQKDVRRQIQHIREVEEQLKQTDKSFTTRTELSEARP